MTSMARILGAEIPRDRLVERLVFHFTEVFQRDWQEKRLKDLFEISDLRFETEGQNLKSEI
jgi:hypothetical protein